MTPAPPPAAEEAFGPRLDLAVRYAELLCTLGVERGLVGPREPERIWSRHLLNCAALAPLLPAGADVVDLGSGAGLPGLPLALARPDLRVTLVEPMERRVRFLTECVAELGLPVEVLRARAEDLPAHSATAVVARALAPLERLLPWAIPVVRPPGMVLALKGRTVSDELEAARPALARWPDVRVRLDLVGTGEDTVRVVRADVGRSPAQAKAGKR